jgi:hypothetical protein
MIAKLEVHEDFSPFPSSSLFINKLERQMADQRGKREQEGVPITYRCQFLVWDSEGRSTREEAFGSALMFKG